MRLKIEATPEELVEKSDELIKALIDALGSFVPGLEDTLEKALPEKPHEMLQPALREIHDKTRKEYAARVKWMLDDISKVLDRSVSKSDDGLSKSGPYIGPRGGRWADPKHTVPWHENVPRERLEDEAHDAVKSQVVEAAHRAVEVGADPRDMKYIGAGMTSIIFESGGKAYKVSRWHEGGKKHLQNEAWAIMSLRGTPAENLVPRVYKYDKDHDVIVREMVNGRSGGWGTKGLRPVYEAIESELAKKEWGHPEYKEDSFIVDDDGKNPIMVDVGFVHPRGNREKEYVEEILESAKSKEDIDLLDLGFSIRSLITEGFISPDLAKKMKAKIVEHYGTSGVEIEGFLRDLDATIERREEDLAKSEDDEPKDPDEQELEPGDVNPDTGEEVPEKEDPDLKPEEPEEKEPK